MEKVFVEKDIHYEFNILTNHLTHLQNEELKGNKRTNAVL